MKKLRPYQELLVKEASVSLAKNIHIIVQSPTGSGKSIVIATIINRALAKGKTCLVLSESAKIFSQLLKECQGVEISSKVKTLYVEPGKCYVAMAQTLANRELIIKQLQALKTDLILLNDEAHIGTLTKTIELFPEAYRLGFTATPAWKWAKHLTKLYKDIVCGPQVDELIQAGHLCTYRHIERRKEGIEGLVIKNGEFTESSQEGFFGRNEVFDGVFEDIKLYPGKKTMVFCASIKQAEDTYNQFIEHGYRACVYHSKSPNGAYELAKFTELNLADFCISVGTLTKGFDYPPIDRIILLRSTTSLPLYLQMLGRGSRPFADTKPDNRFLVLDYGMNGSRHKLYFIDRDWNELWKDEKRKKSSDEGVAPIRICIECESLIPAQARICQYCNAEQPVSEWELQEGITVDLTEKYNALIGRKISTLTPDELAHYAVLKNKKQFAIRVAKALEQQNPGYLSEFGAAMGYNKFWYNLTMDSIIDGQEVAFTDITLK